MIEYVPDRDFKSLKGFLVRLNIVVDELDRLEDFRDADYSDAATDVGFVTVMLEQRRERLQRRGRTQ